MKDGVRRRETIRGGGGGGGVVEEIYEVVGGLRKEGIQRKVVQWRDGKKCVGRGGKGNMMMRYYEG